MIPREAGRGRSFLGAGKYYLQDKGAASNERVGFTHTENVPTDDPHKALKWMAWTAMNAEDLKRESGVTMNGHSCGKPVFTFSLAWHPEQQHERREMIGAGRTALETLGLAHHEALMVSHTDREHPHLHVIVNVVDPETGKANRLSFSRKKLSEWAEDYERQHGKIYCDQRVENNAKRQQGEYVKYREPEVDLKTQITELYRRSDSGAAFQASLAELGFTLAQGKRIVLIDAEGKIYSLSRQIDGVKAKDLRARLDGLDLPEVEAVTVRETAADRTHDSEQPIEVQETDDEAPTEAVDRDQQDRDWNESIIDAAIAHDEIQRNARGGDDIQSGDSRTHVPERPKKPNRLRKEFPLPARPQPSPHRINALQDRHHVELSRFYEEYSQARSRLNANLESQYGAHERELRYEADRLQSVLDNSGPMRLWWLKLTNQIPADAEEELNNKRLSLENIEWRRREAEQALERDVQQRRQAIESRHRTEREELRPEPDRAHVQDCRAGPELSPGQESPDEDHGPSLSY